jgi:hypothetical protein
LPDVEQKFFLAVVHGFHEQNAKATATVTVTVTVAQLKEKFPAFGIKNVILSEHYKERERLDRIVSILRAAGTVPQRISYNNGIRSTPLVTLVVIWLLS